MEGRRQAWRAACYLRANVPGCEQGHLRAFATQLGIPKVAGSAAEIFADPSIDAVLICSSTDTHADFVVQAAAAGNTGSFARGGAGLAGRH